MERTLQDLQRTPPHFSHEQTWKPPSKQETPNQDSGANQDTSVSHRVEVCSMKGFDHGTSHSLIVPVWLHHEDNPKGKVKVYALLDEQSDACFIKESTLTALGVDGPEVNLELSTVFGQKTITSKKVTGLTVRGVNETTEINRPADRSQLRSSDKSARGDPRKRRRSLRQKNRTWLRNYWRNQPARSG